ncbi:unnamed protein product, partial [Larinioides sclopetarius]
RSVGIIGDEFADSLSQKKLKSKGQTLYPQLKDYVEIHLRRYENQSLETKWPATLSLYRTSAGARRGQDHNSRGGMLAFSVGENFCMSICTFFRYAST